MPRSVTNSQIDQLGTRLRRGDPVTEDDFVRLQDLRSEYDAPMGEVERILRDELGLKATSRLKTTNTIIDKLARQTTRLSKMQDIAGLRIVSDMTLTGQDELVKALQERFPNAEVVDRRLHPSHGYRAVHVIPEVDGFPVEIQVRTSTQDAWAQGFEKLSDQIGRGIRYGQPPDDPDAMYGQLARTEVVRVWIDLSRHSAAWEATFADLAIAEARLQALEPDKRLPAELAARLETLRNELAEILGETQALVERMSGRQPRNGEG